MTDTTPTKRPARTPAQRQADLRSRAATLIAEGTDEDLRSAADSLLIEAIGTAYRRGQSYALADIAAELLRRLNHPAPFAKVARPEPEPVTVTRPSEPPPSDRDAEILALRASGMTLRAIAGRFGFASENSVRHILKRAQA